MIFFLIICFHYPYYSLSVPLFYFDFIKDVHNSCLIIFLGESLNSLSFRFFRRKLIKFINQCEILNCSLIIFRDEKMPI